jgi:hypothetical protein
MKPPWRKEKWKGPILPDFLMRSNGSEVSTL